MIADPASPRWFTPAEVAAIFGVDLSEILPPKHRNMTPPNHSRYHYLAALAMTPDRLCSTCGDELLPDELDCDE